MRIISDFSDYYDCVMGMGVDQETMYLRKKRRVVLNKFPFPTFLCHPTSTEPVEFRVAIIGFCGKIYPSLEITYDWTKPSIHCYSVEEVDAVVEAHCSKREVTSYRWKVQRRKRNQWKDYRYWPHRQRRTDVVKFFKECAEQMDKHKQFFIDEGCPIFVARYDRTNDMSITFDDCLKHLGFVRVFDPYTAFQEIYMFMCNLAVPIKPIPEVSDADMVTAKGFNKWSFRKEPRK
jgi:hypothetical protein